MKASRESQPPAAAMWSERRIMQGRQGSGLGLLQHAQQRGFRPSAQVFRQFHGGRKVPEGQVQFFQRVHFHVRAGAAGALLRGRGNEFFARHQLAETVQAIVDAVGR